MKLLPLLLVAAPAAAVERKFFMRLEVVSVTGMADVDGGVKNAADICYEAGSDVLIRAEIGDEGKLAEAKQGFSSGISQTDTLELDWKTNILDATLGQEVRVSAVDYNDPKDLPVDGALKEIPCNTVSQLTYCQLTETDCNDALSRHELCKVMYNMERDNCVDASGVGGCGGGANLMGGATAQQCYDSAASCNDAQASITANEPGGSTDVNGNPINYSPICWNRNRQPMGSAGVLLPADVQEDAGVGVQWENAKYGDRKQFSNLQTMAYTSVKRTTGNLNAAPGESVAGEVVYKLQFWASQCSMGEYINEVGWCAQCEAGYTCTNGVTQDGCGPGSFSAQLGFSGECELCPVETFQSSSASTACNNCTEGTFNLVPGADICATIVVCDQYEREISPRDGDIQAVCEALSGIDYDAAKLGMTKGQFIAFILVIIIVCIIALALAVLWYLRQQRLSKLRAAQLAREKGDLEMQMKATENLAINPLMTQAQAGNAPEPAPVEDHESRRLLKEMQKENAELRAELKRLKMSDQQGKMGKGSRKAPNRAARKEFGQTTA